MFVARENELQRIKNYLTNRGAMIIYGLRRVGKTTLIKKALDDEQIDYIYFECQKADEETNVALFTSLLKEKYGFIDAEFKSFLSVFKEIKKNFHNIAIAIDEYSYLKQYYLESKKPETKLMASSIDSEFQNIIDEYLGDNHLIISGSSIHIMEKLLDHNSPLYGRFEEIISLKQFNYYDAKKMLNKLNEKELIAFYSVFGGSPFVLEKIDTNKTLKENICHLLLNENGKLRNHLKNNVINELESDIDLNNILNIIKNGSKKYGEIENKCHIETAGLLDKRLKKLMELDIIEAKYPINREHDKRKKYYQIKDNLLKFYYAYVFREDNRINLLGEERYYDLYIRPSIGEFIARRFENIVRDYFSLAIKKGLYQDIVDIGTFFTDQNEFDCVLKKNNGTYMIYEVKWLKNPLKVSEMHKEIAQAKEIKGLDNIEVGFVSSSGYEEKINGISYLNLAELFFDKN